MLKRQFVLLILILFMFESVGCSSDSQDMYQKYKEESERIWNADSIFFESKINIIDQSNNDNQLNLQKLIKVKNIWSDNDNLNKEVYEEINATNDNKDTFVSSKTLSYYKDGMFYTHDFYSDQYIKASMGQNAMIEYDSLFRFVFDEEDISDISSEKNQVIFRLKDKPILALIRKLNNQNSPELQNYEIKDTAFTVHYKDNNQINSYEVKFTLKNDKLISKYHMTFQVNQLNDVTIDYPSDWDHYKGDTL